MNRTLSKIKKPTWVANQIIKIFADHQGTSFLIYFNDKRWDISVDYDTKKWKNIVTKEVTENIKASEYGEYLNDDVISVDFGSDTILWEQMTQGGYEFDMSEFGGGQYHNTGWKLVNALDKFMEENGLARENGTETDFIVVNEEDL